ncbi:DUF2798 domain-containing protein [Acinetobacter rudis]|uniref:DUF2798 domain-containing protein n=1 Tax=Acinetobacter rudis CIP 110305 TaxID=421052 RepID=S3PMT8_9GAMM|nr:DUF2798 domain-containing protein [Acinetobacter rudis]EPF80116.1 hypothetical protein F945_00568 [Acinetobacter rudis CIP 110305]
MSSTTIKKLPARFNGIVMPLLLSIFMTCIVSCISTLKSLGFEHFQFMLWLSAWGLSWLIAFPSLLLALPIVKKITALLVTQAT